MSAQPYYTGHVVEDCVELDRLELPNPTVYFLTAEEAYLEGLIDVNLMIELLQEEYS